MEAEAPPHNDDTEKEGILPSNSLGPKTALDWVGDDDPENPLN